MRNAVLLLTPPPPIYAANPFYISYVSYDPDDSAIVVLP